MAPDRQSFPGHHRHACARKWLDVEKVDAIVDVPNSSATSRNRADGRVTHPIYLFEIKKPAESKYPYDYYKLLSTVPADKAFRPMDQGGCLLVK
jgi:hypothetical protein